jgi:hypothetical protein
LQAEVFENFNPVQEVESRSPGLPDLFSGGEEPGCQGVSGMINLVFLCRREVVSAGFPFLPEELFEYR